jgi:hypothetical protein
MMNRDEIIIVTRQALAQVDRRFRFDVIEAGVRQDGEWWYVPVLAEGPNGVEPTHEFLVNAYANIEEQLQVEQHINVMFVPAAA